MPLHMSDQTPPSLTRSGGSAAARLLASGRLEPAMSASARVSQTLLARITEKLGSALHAAEAAEPAPAALTGSGRSAAVDAQAQGGRGDRILAGDRVAVTDHLAAREVGPHADRIRARA